MIVKRRLSLWSSAVLAELVVRREDLEDAQMANELLTVARVDIEQMLAGAKQHAQEVLDQALAEFWGTANEFLQSLEELRLNAQRDAVASAEELLNLALERLLDETDLAERVRAMVRCLATSQMDEAAATLSCHPQLLDPLIEWLGNSRFVDYWLLKSDASMETNALRLSNASGAFDIDWHSLRRGLLT